MSLLVFTVLQAIGEGSGGFGGVPWSVAVVGSRGRGVNCAAPGPAAEFVQIVKELVSGAGQGRRGLPVLGL